MSYQALYRVWRPQRFSDLIGQEHITQTLMNALQESKFSHAYLFSGPRGTGKTSAAKLFAKAVNCENGPQAEPCNECHACKSIQAGSSLDVVEIDAASNRGVDEIRDLRENVRYAPTDVRYKVYIIDEVHMLTTEAFNALLKTLEEPPSHVIFILATTEPHKLLPTILSRCQRFPFRRIQLEKMVSRLSYICEREEVDFEESALWAIARLADGGMRDALSMLDQAISFGAGVVKEETIHAMVGSVSPIAIWNLLRDVLETNTQSALEKVDSFIQDGLEPDKLIQDCTLLCRDILLSKTSASQERDYPFLEKEISYIQTLSVSRLTSVMEELLQASQQLKWTPYPRIFLEMLIIRLAQTDQELADWNTLQKKVTLLERQVEQLSTKGLPVQSSQVKQAETAPELKPPSVQSKPARSPASSVAITNKLQGFGTDGLPEIKRGWNQVLHKVKEEKITVHAWLVDGEPVAVRGAEVLVAFRSKIHRDTTEKAMNRQLIEHIMRQVYAKPYQLKTIMLTQWEESVDTKKAIPQNPILKEKKDTATSLQDDIVKKAKDLFGNEVVEVYDENQDLNGGNS
ncbi:DNA polymerase III subunit gamma/tau [Risungbinella massiliensis]|uniref:DNA polymerase III subunit gamma/tau n=1 Tax=Risungbinella massiliensis TaxID=1329796 RepID=UPI0005CBF81F|nr:DNA polymerase III subunit gamma/tau [Risungbinella massiliensis]